MEKDTMTIPLPTTPKDGCFKEEPSVMTTMMTAMMGSPPPEKVKLTCFVHFGFLHVSSFKRMGHPITRHVKQLSSI
eukprot:scaffold67923_cov47-Attheya_sp.AAC.2